MRLHRFFLQEEIPDSKTFIHKNKELFHQLKNVFRFAVGGQVILFDNSGYEYHAMVSEFRNGEVVFSIIKKYEKEFSPFRELHLFFSLIKKDNVEWVLEKGTELGVTRFIPIITDRSEKKSFHEERARKIIIEASEQSGRTRIPEIAPLSTLEDSVLQSFPCFAFDPQGDVFTTPHAHNFPPLGAFIGPEGGFTERELFLMKQHNVRVYSLGDQILRAETASVAVATLLLLG